MASPTTGASIRGLFQKPWALEGLLAALKDLASHFAPGRHPALKDAFRAQGNTETIIVHDLVARLLMTLATGAGELVPSIHPHDRGIG